MPPIPLFLVKICGGGGAFLFSRPSLIFQLASHRQISLHGLRILRLGQKLISLRWTVGHTQPSLGAPGGEQRRLQASAPRSGTQQHKPGVHGLNFGSTDAVGLN